MVGLNLVRSPKDKSDLDQDLTFEEVCPVWSKNLRKRLDRRDRHMLAKDSKYCLGFQWKAGYYIAPLIPVVGCWVCVKYGQKFGKVAKRDEFTGSHFEQLISEFLAHWNRNHKSITRGSSANQVDCNIHAG